MGVANLFKSIIIMCIGTMISSSSSNDNMNFIGFHTISHMPYAASDMAVVAFPEEYFTSGGPRIYLTGGCTSDQSCTVYSSGILMCYCQSITDKVIYFTPEDNKWFTATSVMPRSRYRHMTAKVGKYLYVVGGRNLDDSLIQEIDRYDPQADTWESNVFTWSNATSDGGAFAVDDLLFLVGGYDGIYNTLANLTALNTTSGEWTDFPSMQLGRGDIAVTPFEGNNFYVLGGWNAQTSNGFCVSSQDVEFYSYSTNTWTTVQDMALPRGDLAVGVLDGSIFAVGGETKDPADKTCSYSIPIKYVERYHKDTNSWNEEESIPDDLFRFSGVSYNSSASVFNSAIYLFGGQGTYDATKMIYPVKDTTIKYIPRSTVHSNPKLSPGGIAGIVLAGIIVLGAIVVGVIAYLGYRRRYQYKNLNDIEAQEESAKADQNTLELTDIKESFEATL